MAITDRVTYAKPTLPTIGAAGSAPMTDPTFGSRIARATDGAFITDLGTTGRSFRSPASGYQKAWNASGTKFYVLHGDSRPYLVSFNRTTMATARIGATYLDFNGTCTFDQTDSNIMYGLGLQANAHTISKVDVSSVPFVTTVLVDLDTVTGGLPNPSYVGAVVEGNGNLMCTYGGAGQEYHHYVLWYPIASPGSKKVIDTSTLNGMDEFNTHFTIHSAQIDKSGRYVDLVPSTIAGAPYRNYIWDTTLDTVTAVTANSGGHEALGYSARINSDTIGPYDAIQFILTPSLLAPNSNKVQLISPLLTPQEIYAADHTTWNNAQSGSMQPVFSGIYRVYDGPLNTNPKNTVAFRAWDDEIIGVATDGSGTVTRYCHHRSPVYPEVGVAPDDFWYTPRPNVDQQGQFAIFTSNWDKTLGTDSAEGNSRQDVFVVELLGATALLDARVRTMRAGRRFFAR